MTAVTFITGNQGKANHLAKFLGVDIAHQALELDEIQSVDLQEIAEHKAEQAYKKLGSPVLVDDTGLYFNAMGRLPGPFIKWFLQEIKPAGICRLLDAYDDRSAAAEVCVSYYDGKQLKTIRGNVKGRIPPEPVGENGYGWDSIFVPDGADKTYAQMNEAEIRQFGVRVTQVFPALRDFLQTIDIE